jgi:hypothetical protein
MDDFFSINTPVSRRLHGRSPSIVQPTSALATKKCVETLAYYFKRECDYDFIQFEAAETLQSLGYVPYEAWLFHEDSPNHSRGAHDDPQRVIGAACFRLIEWADAPPGWELQWVWFHPYRRRHGLLTAAWPGFRERYRDYALARPLSEAMERFIRKVEPATQHALTGRVAPAAMRPSPPSHRSCD